MRERRVKESGKDYEGIKVRINEGYGGRVLWPGVGKGDGCVWREWVRRNGKMA